MLRWFKPELIEALGLTERNPGVLVCQGESAFADRQLIEGLRRCAEESPGARARILFHGQEEDGLQQMMIAARRMTIWPPHINDGGAKSWTAMDGDVAFVQYTPPGNIERILRLSSSDDRAPAFFRLSAERWHTIVPLSEMPVYLETKRGPHRTTRFADWGPQNEDHPEADLLRKRLGEIEVPSRV